MDVVGLGVLAYILGIVVNVLYPYVVAYLEHNEPFNYKYAISRIIGALVLGLVAVVNPGFVDWLTQTAAIYGYTWLYFIAIFLTTFGASSIARETEKLTKNLSGR